ncbi:MAG: PQQ-binding-like beta-propeller repeat protein [Aureliella sp.]
MHRIKTDFILVTSLLLSLASLPVPKAVHANERISSQSISDSFSRELEDAHGLCIIVGINESTSNDLGKCDGLLVHCLDSDPSKTNTLRKKLPQLDTGSASITIETWNASRLPHTDNLANVVVLNDTSMVPREELLRVLQPGGIILQRNEVSYSRYRKGGQEDRDEWTHQWHSTDGSLTTEDDSLGVPTGLQWLSGPLFAMAGRKSSTQTLVSSNGVNFYVTQNVLENVGKPIESMDQYLVARDAHNGLLIWQKPWKGPFVTGNGETNARMIASQDRLYLVDVGNRVCLLDARNGTQICEYAESEPVEKIVLHQDRLLIETKAHITALAANLEERHWSFATRNLSALTIDEDHCYCLSSGRSEDGRFRHDLVCLDVGSGEVRFVKNTQPQIEAASLKINFAKDDFVALQSHGYLHVYDSNGEHLWSRETTARPGKSYVDERYVGHFYRNGLIWMLMQNSPRESIGQNKWLGLNPVDGKLARELTPQGEWPRTATPAKMGCQILLASDRYIMIPRQSTFIDFEDGSKHSFKFTRGGCGLGFVAANGLLYSHPHACGCFSEAIRGFMGMHSTPADQITASAADFPELIASAMPQVAVESTEQPWPTFRSTNERSAEIKTTLLAGAKPGAKSMELKVKRLWSLELSQNRSSVSQQAWKLRTGNPITSATIAYGHAFVAEVDSGHVHAIDLDTGVESWKFAAASRVDTPPTLQSGLALFGSHDGYVYCLEATTGEFVWKHRVAPTERRIVAFGALESTWPVTGATIVQSGRVFAAAGRAPDADGGIHVASIDIRTGEARWKKQIEDADFWGLSDLLVADEKWLYLSDWQFDFETGENQKASDDSLHLQGGKVGLLEASWTKHDLALRKDIQTWKASGSTGQLIAFGKDFRAAFDAESHLLTIDGQEHHEFKLPAGEQITSLVLTPEHAFVAGGLQRSDVHAGGFLRIIELASGNVVSENTLASEAVLDGLSLAANRILVATQDGKLSCFEATPN